MSDRPELKAVPDERPRKRWKSILFVIVAVIALGAAAFGLSQTSAFAVGRISVTGNEHVSPEDVQTLSGVAQGTPMVSVDGEAVDRKLRQNPWIESASVVHDWPDAITIEVTERRAVGAVQTDDGRWSQVAGNGAVLQVDDNVTAGLPVLINQKVSPQIGAVVTENAQQLLTLIGQLPDSLRPKTVQVERQDDGQLRLGLSTGPIIELGGSEDIGDKLMAAAAVIAKEDNSEIGILDVRSARLPISTPKTTTTTVPPTAEAAASSSTAGDATSSGTTTTTVRSASRSVTTTTMTQT